MRLADLKSRKKLQAWGSKKAIPRQRPEVHRQDLCGKNPFLSNQTKMNLSGAEKNLNCVWKNGQ